MNFSTTNQLQQSNDTDKMVVDGEFNNHYHHINPNETNHINSGLSRSKSLSHYSIDSEEGLDQFLSSQLFDFEMPHEDNFPDNISSKTNNNNNNHSASFPNNISSNTNNVNVMPNNNNHSASFPNTNQFMQMNNQLFSQNTNSSQNIWPQSNVFSQKMNNNHTSTNGNFNDFNVFRTTPFFQSQFPSTQLQLPQSTLNGPMTSPLFPFQSNFLPHPQQPTSQPPMQTTPFSSLTLPTAPSTSISDSTSTNTSHVSNDNNQDTTVAVVKKRRLDSSPVAISTTISWIDASSLQGDEDGLDDDGEEDDDDDAFVDDQDDGELSSSSEAAVSFARVKGSSHQQDLSVIPEDMMTRARTRRGKIPRLVKHDIRRYYGRMLYNVMNSHDRHLILRWFQTFAVQSMKLFRLETLGPIVYADANQPEAQLIAGRNSAVSYLLEVQRKIPDLVTRLNDHYQVLRWKERRSSQIVFQATYTGTAFEYFPQAVKQQEQQQQIQEPLLTDDTESVASSHNNTTVASASQQSQAEDWRLPQEAVLSALPDEFDPHAPSPIAPSVSDVSPPDITNRVVFASNPPMRKISHLVQFNMTIETTLHLNDEMLLFRWESKTLNSQTKRIPYNEL